MPIRKKIVLFDIDGTLIRRAGPHHRRALERACTELAGRPVSIDGISTHGMLDTAITDEMLRRAGVEEDLARQIRPRIQPLAEEAYAADHSTTLRDKVCPGVETILEFLSSEEIPLALVTGNYAAIGWKKMDLAGLRPYFTDGAFAGMSETRTGLVELMMQRAAALDANANGSRFVLVGDSPSDIKAARDNGIRVLAVATGINTYEELAGERPDFLTHDLTDPVVPSILAG
jgi:phosphoglycolate phosphatase-like HAD superfamily hydrolase